MLAFCRRQSRRWLLRRRPGACIIAFAFALGLWQVLGIRYIACNRALLHLVSVSSRVCNYFARIRAEDGGESEATTSELTEFIEKAKMGNITNQDIPKFAKMFKV